VFSRVSDIRTAAAFVAPIWKGKKYFLATSLQKINLNKIAHLKNYIFQKQTFD